MQWTRSLTYTQSENTMKSKPIAQNDDVIFSIVRLWRLFFSTHQSKMFQSLGVPFRTTDLKSTTRVFDVSCQKLLLSNYVAEFFLSEIILEAFHTWELSLLSFKRV